MKYKMLKAAAFTVGAIMTLGTATVSAQQDAKSLDELLGFVKQGQTSEAKENKEVQQLYFGKVHAEIEN